MYTSWWADSQGNHDPGISEGNGKSNSNTSSQASTSLTPSETLTSSSTSANKPHKFSFCGKFTGKDVSATHWPKAFSHELEDFQDAEGNIPPKTYLKYLDLLLIDNAADWLETNADASRLMESVSPSQDTIEHFVSLIKERFPSKAVEELLLSFHAELLELRQRVDETLTSYYSRAINFIRKYAAKDRSAGKTLSLAESSLLDTFLRQWVEGLTNSEVKRKAAEGMAATDRSLRKVSTVADEARRVNLEIERLFEDEQNENDLVFYKKAERNLTLAQIQAMRASYKSGDESAYQYKPTCASIGPSTSGPFQVFKDPNEDRPKRKGQKRVGKRTEPTPLVGMFNERYWWLRQSCVRSSVAPGYQSRYLMDGLGSMVTSGVQKS